VVKGVRHEYLFPKAMKKYLLPIILSIFSFNAIFAQSGQTYTVTLDHNDKTGVTEQITATYGKPMPEDIGLVAPTRIGYDFTGYSRNGTYYYDADLKSVRKYNKAKDFIIYANWRAHTTTVYLDFQEGENGTDQVISTYNKAMPIGEEIVAPVRLGYTFAGYYTDINGNGIQYYNADMTSKRNWDKDVAEIQLYAYWTPNVIDVIDVTDITLSDLTANLWVGETKTLTATITPAAASNTNVIWSSSNESIATVSSDGIITAVDKGSCTITCTAADGSGITSTCDVTVKQQVASIDFGYETLDMTAGTVKTLTADITPSNADIETLVWESSNTNVVNITSEGVLTAITPGTATIKCTANDEYEATITVNVTPLNITNDKPAIAEGTYGEGGIILTRSLTENKCATFCMPYDINLSEYTDNFSKVYVPMGMALLKSNGTLIIMYKDVPFTETIPAGQPFIVYGAQSGSVSIMNSSEVTISSLTNPEPINLDVYNWNGSDGFITLNSDISLKIGGSYTKLSGLDKEKYYVFTTSGSIKNSAGVSPYRLYVYKNDDLSKAKITDIQFSLNEDNTVTGIENIVNEQSNNDNVYNLNGQRINVSNVQNGVYIFNGKKYMK
jgi:uncharacterized protein YjdB